MQVTGKKFALWAMGPRFWSVKCSFQNNNKQQAELKPTQQLILLQRF